MIRLYRNYDPSLFHGPVQMVSAFRGLNEVLQVKRGTGVVTDWKQPGGTLMVGGDSRIVRVWDAHTESQVMVRPSSIWRWGWLRQIPSIDAVGRRAAADMVWH